MEQLQFSSALEKRFFFFASRADLVWSQSSSSQFFDACYTNFESKTDYKQSMGGQMEQPFLTGNFGQLTAYFIKEHGRNKWYNDFPVKYRKEEYIWRYSFFPFLQKISSRKERSIWSPTGTAGFSLQMESVESTP